MNPNKTFDMHEINRLIMREQIPGFKMLPKEKAYLEEYRKALKEFHGYEKEDPEESRARAERLAKIEARKAAIKNKKANKKNAEQPVADLTEPNEPEQPTEQPIEAEQLDVTVVEPIMVDQVTEAEIVEDKPTEEQR